MSSPASPEPLDLERGLPVTAADRDGLRRARALTALGWRDYAAFLAAQPPVTHQELRRRPLLTGEAFRLEE